MINVDIIHEIDNTLTNNPFNDNILDVSVENFNITNIRKTLYKLFNSVVSFIRKVYNWVKVKVLKIFKIISYNLKRNGGKIDLINRIIEIKEGNLSSSTVNKITELIKSNDVVSVESLPNSVNSDQIDELIRFFKEYRLNFIGLLFDEDGKLHDIEQLVKNMNARIKEIANLDIHMVGTSNINHNEDWKKVLDMKEYFQDLRDENTKARLSNDYWKFRATNLFKYVPKIEELSELCLTTHNKLKFRLDADINRIKKEMDEYFKVLSSKERNYVYNGLYPMDPSTTYAMEEYIILMKRLKVLESISKVSLIPYSVLMGYVRMINVIEKDIFSKEYINVPVSEQSLLHLSDNPDLDSNSRELSPKFVKSGLAEFLPARISFSPTIEQCCIGVYHHIDKGDMVSQDDKYLYRDFFVYEGIPDKDTKCVDPKIVQAMVDDAKLSGEIAVTTPIKIKKVGKIRVYFLQNFAKYDTNKFEKIDWLEKY